MANAIACIKNRMARTRNNAKGIVVLKNEISGLGGYTQREIQNGINHL